MKHYSFDFRHQGLCGTVYLPSADTAAAPTAVFCHGWGGSRKLFRYTEKLLGYLLKNGCCVVTFDFFGCGDSDGDHERMTYGLWANNIKTIVGWASSQPFADPRRIGLVAFSSGSTAAFRYALDASPAFIVSVAACITPNIGMSEGGPYGRDGGVFMGKKVWMEFFSDCICNAPAERLHGIKCPVLLLQGGADNVWRRQDSLYAAKMLPDCKIKIYDGSPHSLSAHSGPASRDTVSWLREIHII